MKNILKKIGIIMLMLCLTMGVLPADFSAVTASAATQTKASYKNEWVKKGNKWYYYNAKGKMLKNTWKTINGKRYYLGSDGARKQNGWYTVYDKENKVNYSYYFDKNGVFTKKASTFKKIDRDLVEAMDDVITGQKIKASTKADAAIKKLYTLVRDKYGFDNLSARGFHPESAEKDWEYGFAKEMLTAKKGSCHHYAAVLAFLVKRATGLPVRIATGTAEVYTKGSWLASHSWVEVKINGKWYTYDPMIDKNKKNRTNLNFALYKLAPAKAKSHYKVKKYFDVNI